MGIGKVSSLAVASLAKVNSLAKLSINKINATAASFAAVFTDDNAVSKSVTTGTGNRVWIEDSNGNYNFDENDALTVSFWIKAGWTTSLNGNLYLFSSADVEGTGANDQSFRIFYYENNNRLYVAWRSDASNKRQNFWLFHSTAGNYNTAYQAAGLGTSYWTNTNRGNVGDDNYTLITVTRGTTESAASSNLKLYWNDADCGVGYYASGNHTGNPEMGTENKQIALGSTAWSPWQKCGDTNATQYNGLTIWNKALSADEVTELYNSGTPMDASGHTAVDNLVGWWNFESDGSNEVSGNPDFEILGDSAVGAK